MSDSAICFQNVSKIFRVYHHPLYQFLGLFSPKWLSKNSYIENKALSGIDFEIKKGSKVGVIGRNGSGKSTLLKIVSGRISPSAGVVNVNGNVSGLLELGTGFHPEFSGRENVFSSLAYMGIVGQEAKKLFNEIVDFSELDHFIDQPVRAYSTGMYMRLAFSISTSIKPELLLVDEVLSVGDSHFTHKCLERMKDLSSNEHTTILFVSHNIYALTFLCDFFVWLDGGKIRKIGKGSDILSSYEISVREDEEKRLAEKSASSIAIKRDDHSKSVGSGHARIMEVRLENERGEKQYLYHRDETIVIAIKYKISDELEKFDPIFDIGVTREDGLTVCCFIFKVYSNLKEGTVKIILRKPQLIQNNYLLTILLFEKLDMSGHKNKFYTVNENLCDAQIRCYEFRIEGSPGVETTVFTHPYEVAGNANSKVELFNAL